MTREKILFLIAVLMIVLPHLGLTNLMEQISFFVLGLIVMIFAYGLYFEKKNKEKIPTQTSPKTPRRTRATPPPVFHEPTFRSAPEADETHGFKIIKKDSQKSEEDNFHI